MQSSEHIIEQTYLGERIEFIDIPQKEAQENFIEFYHYMFWKGSGYMREHVHPHHDELFEVVKGRAQYYIKGKRYKARAGSVIFIPRGYRHINPHNAWFSELVIKKKDVTDFKTDRFYKQLYSLANKNRRTVSLSLKECLKLNLLTNGNTVFTPVPGFIQRIVIGLSRLFGGS